MYGDSGCVLDITGLGSRNVYMYHICSTGKVYAVSYFIRNGIEWFTVLPCGVQKLQATRTI